MFGRQNGVTPPYYTPHTLPTHPLSQRVGADAPGVGQGMGLQCFYYEAPGDNYWGCGLEYGFRVKVFVFVGVFPLDVPGMYLHELLFSSLVFPLFNILFLFGQFLCLKRIGRLFPPMSTLNNLYHLTEGDR